MAEWKQVITHLAYDAERHMDNLRYRMHYALGGVGPVKIIPYRGYGRRDLLYLRGRVIEDKGIPEAEQNDRLWENLLNMYRRLESDEVPYARVAVRFQGVEQIVTANEEGFFEAWIEPSRPLAEHRMWHPVELELVDPIPELQGNYPITATGEVLVPPPSSKFGVISDIDDTVVRSDATHLIKMARNVFLGNAHTRLPFPGVAALYRALYSGATGNEYNPPFYLSSSPWNLYDLLSQFFNLQRIPEGPVLFLRDWGINEDEIMPIKHRTYKSNIIRQMLGFFPELPFILIGDSGQEDPEIYADMLREFPGRIKAVYIRNVSRDLKRPEAIRELAKKVLETGGSLVLADDSAAIARHAIEHGLITPAELSNIIDDKNKDESPPNPLDKLLGDEPKVEPPTVEVQGRSDNEKSRQVKSGAVEEAVKKAGKEQTKEPPTVVVESKESEKNKK